MVMNAIYSRTTRQQNRQERIGHPILITDIVTSATEVLRLCICNPEKLTRSIIILSPSFYLISQLIAFERINRYLTPSTNKFTIDSVYLGSQS